MTDKKKPHTASTGTAKKTKFDSRDHTGNDPLIGWFNLAKPSRDRQPKRSWKRGKQHGRIDANLAAQLALLVVLALLIFGGVQA